MKDEEWVSGCVFLAATLGLDWLASSSGGVLSYFKGFFGQKEIRILILGLDG